jgi:MSHA biogenesis protein MshN
MSVINDMLRDLEKRRGPLRETGAVPRCVRVPPREPQVNIPWRALSGGALALACFGVVGSYLYQAASSPDQLMAEVAKPVASRAEAPPVVTQEERGAAPAVVPPETPPAPVATASVVTAEPTPPAAVRSRGESASDSRARERNAASAVGATGAASPASELSADPFLTNFSLRMDALPPQRWAKANTETPNSSTRRSAAAPDSSTIRSEASTSKTALAPSNGEREGVRGELRSEASTSKPVLAPSNGEREGVRGELRSEAPTSKPALTPSDGEREGVRGELRPSPRVSTGRSAGAANSSTVRSAMPSSSGRPQIDRKMRELTASQRAENEYRLGANLLNQGRQAEAQTQFAAALRHAPEHVGARQALFGLLLQNNRVDEAEKVLQAGVKIDPTQPGFAMALARFQVDRGDTAAAVETLQNAFQLGQANPDFLAFLAALLQRQGRHAQAVELYESALALAPRSGLWLIGLGISLQALNRNSEAHDAFRRARAADGLTGELQAFADQRLKQVE